MNIALLHPGQMGSSVGDALVDSGHQVGWCSAGRSEASRNRAIAFTECENLEELLVWAECAICICPPEDALAQAKLVAEVDFSGIYLDGNAVAPNTAAQIAALFGDRYVDGGIIGPPARQSGTTRLYVSGGNASEIVELFTQGCLECLAVEGDVYAASNLKMAFAAYTKGSSALLMAVNALAKAAGVDEALKAEWAISQPKLAGQSELTAPAIAPKAWRFAGEMQEIARTFQLHGLPDGFHKGAHDLYARLSEFKDQPGVTLDMVLSELVKRD
ncbi:MAG: DUF1932 domain-containing protein [Pseudomonadota bacterium]